ncbi:MAG TPA: Fe-Mn family superoxide dismutase [Burkholderiales bacterium]|nr:Fe-Mn family superoxide dismutase [Burkholderiales bacterium]
MEHKLPPLPFARDALQPYMSKETMDFHYGKHHKTYVDTLNKLIKGTEFEASSLEEIVMNSSGKIFNNAAQVWNHTFFWDCLSPDGGKEPKGELKKAIEEKFGSFEEFKNKFKECAVNEFGSGWTWMVRKPDGSLAVENTSDAVNPMTSKKTALLTLDVWEHAYYIDYRNARPDYVGAFWNVVNWKFVAKNFAS